MRVHRSFLPGLSGLTAVLFSVSCGVDSPAPIHRAPRSAERVLHQWYDDGGTGQVTIRISLTDQIAEFHRSGREIGWCYVATGKEGYGTRAGNYTITEKIVDKYSNRYGWMEDEFGNVVNDDAKSTDRVPKGQRYVPAPMPYWMRLTSYGIGMHGGYIPEPGKPASHGCIRLPKDFVPVLFDSVSVGTPVTITNSPAKQGPRMHSPSEELYAEGSSTMAPIRRMTAAEYDALRRESDGRSARAFRY